MNLGGSVHRFSHALFVLLIYEGTNDDDDDYNASFK